MAKQFEDKPKRGALSNESPYSFDQDNPPRALSCLAYQIGRVKSELEKRGRHWPEEIPYKPLEAAQWWIERQSPCARDEKPRLSSCHQTDGGQRWQLPYHNRLISTFVRYCCLPVAHRDLISAAIVDGVYWRGEEVIAKDGGPGHFVRVYDETLQAREYDTAAQYVVQTKLFDRMRSVMRGMQS